MDERKIIQFGNSSYVVTLPQGWIKRNNLKKGDSIDILETNNSITISSQVDLRDKVAEITLDGMPLKLFNRELISYYLKNYKLIQIKCNNCLEKLEEIRVLKEKLSSVEIVEINKEQILLKDLSNPKELDIKKLTSDIIEMIKVLFDELSKAESSNRQYIINNLDSNINKLTFLSYKSLNYQLEILENIDYVKNVIQYHRITSALESLGDIIKRISRYLKDSEKYMGQIAPVIKNIKSYFDFVTSLLEPNLKVGENLKLYLDKKQSLLREFENLREVMKDNVNLYLVITQLFKDLLGQLDNVLLSVIDLQCK